MSSTEKSPTRGRKSRTNANRPTVADVARAAEVSLMTVSRVVNHGTNVSEETRKKVEAAIAELGYVPNQAARNLAGGREVRIALLYSNPSSAYLSEFLMGSLGEASVNAAQIIVEYCEEGVRPADLVGKLAAHRANAVLLPPPLCDDERLLKRLQKAGLPMAQIATGRPSRHAYAVTIDDAGATEDLVRLLIEQGHSRIGYISGNPNQTVSELRQAGYEKALADADIAPRPDLIVSGDFSYRSGLQAAERLLASTEPPTAIVASNDDMAAAALAVAHRHGLDVPGDLSVCGFDDTAMATTIWPELTTIRQPISEMARQATAMLIADVRESPVAGVDARHVRLDCELVRRASHGPPRDMTVSPRG